MPHSHEGKRREEERREQPGTQPERVFAPPVWRTGEWRGGPASAVNQCGSRNCNDQDQETEQGEWWLQVNSEHPHVAIELIESYKRIAGVSLGEVNYNLLLQSGARHGPSAA